MTDETIQTVLERIRAVLERNTSINLHASKLNITERGHQIVLEGTVEDITAKRIAVNLARNLVGNGYTVDDQLCIQTSNVSDGELRDRIANTLLSEPVFRDCDILVRSGEKSERLRNKGDPEQGVIEVAVANGVATLTGQVISLTHRRIAEVLLWWIDGCQRVDNLLKVVPDEVDTDAELTDAVRIVLEKDPFIDAGQVRVAIKGGVVELFGLLASEEQKETALRDVWSVPDVWDVHNHITVAA